MKLFLMLLLAAGLASPASGEISFKSRVDKVQAAFEDEFVLTLEVAVSDPQMTTTPVPPPEIVGFRIGGSGSSVEKQGEFTVRRYTYDLKPARSGEVTIPAFKVEFKSITSVDTLSSEPIVVNVDQPKPRSDGSVSLAPIIVTGVCAGAVIAFLLVRSRRKRGAHVPEPDWRADAQEKFEEIKKLADREDYRQFSAQAMKFVVGLLERVHEARLMGFTSTDILRWMDERGLEKEIRGQAKELFEFCEEVKFSSGKVEVQRGRAAVANATKLLELILK